MKRNFSPAYHKRNCLCGVNSPSWTANLKIGLAIKKKASPLSWCHRMKLRFLQCSVTRWRLNQDPKQLVETIFVLG